MDYTQFGCPRGEGGRLILEDMNIHHRPLSEWAIEKLSSNYTSILDVGCGGGMQLSILSMKYPTASLIGVDISEEAVAKALETNRKDIDSGRCKILKASVFELPFGDCTFDLVTAFETYFFWSDLSMAIKEIHRVLKLGKCFQIVSEQYPHPNFNDKISKLAKLCNFKLVTNEEMVQLLDNNGFFVKVDVIEDKNWVCFTAIKN